MRYLAMWYHYGLGEDVYFQFEAENEAAADEIVISRQLLNGYTPGDYELFEALSNKEDRPCG